MNKFLRPSLFLLLCCSLCPVQSNNHSTTTPNNNETTTVSTTTVPSSRLETNNKTTGDDKKSNNGSVGSSVHHHILDVFLTHGHLAANGSVKDKEEAAVTEKTNKSDENVGLQDVIDMIVNHTHNSVGLNKNFSEEGCTTPAIKQVNDFSSLEEAELNRRDRFCLSFLQFPHPIMSENTRKHGGLLIHVIVAIYMFIGLAIVCDEYFVASLDRICEELKLAPDVAGATFMAAGSSAPELATVIIGVFLAKDDIGISGVIGSAVFNIMFVIACCGLCSGAVVYLNWWPLIRDSFFYALSILVMLVVIFDKKISWVESLCMLITYLVYCVVLHFNTPLERWAQTWPVPFKVVPQPTEQSGLVSYRTLDDENKRPSYGVDQQPGGGYGDGMHQEDQQQQNVDYSDPSMNNFGMAWSPEKYQNNFAGDLSGPDLNRFEPEPASIGTANAGSTVAVNQPTVTRPVQPEYYKPKEYDPAAHPNPLIKPENANWMKIGFWGMVYPIHWMCRKTMPDCRSEKYRNWYPFTFFVSMVWISFYSYFMVWMITIIGYTLGIPDTVMGLTFVAAGVSVPDALSSVAVIKEGYGDMAVSNAVGSNVFDILICLGLPWFIKTAIIKPGSTVKVISKGLTYSTLSLLSTVAFLVVAIHMNGWKLDRRFGAMLMVWYVLFIIFASLYELNVFGYMNPPECQIDW
ncbi:unnamed protein product [Phyllotreta striolata]|uniref:Sodium/calcium exchanger membrane region domain-containing protein n=1 Tax=Phyllotreta striolata TaxID=444603 RepID=A0A9P0DQR8_PHYSR|nr:unnamed protein product [Phyllotreta striolata]